MPAVRPGSALLAQSLAMLLACALAVVLLVVWRDVDLVDELLYLLVAGAVLGGFVYFTEYHERPGGDAVVRQSPVRLLLMVPVAAAGLVGLEILASWLFGRGGMTAVGALLGFALAAGAAGLRELLT